MRCRRASIHNAAVDEDRELGPALLLTVYGVVNEWRHLTILFGAQPRENRNARVNIEMRAACRRQGIHKRIEKRVVVAVVNANARLHRDRNRDGFGHGLQTARHGLGLCHKTGTKRALLHALAGAADIDIHGIVAGLLSHLRRLAHELGLTATDLQHHGMLLGVEREQPLGVAVHERGGRHHFGVEHG